MIDMRLSCVSLTNYAWRLPLAAAGMTLLVAGPALAPSLIAEGLRDPGALKGREIAASERADTGATASVTGTVYDSVAHAPLAGADVQLVDLKDNSRAYTARADSLGRFRIDSVRPGDYAAGFFHAALDALGMEPPLTAARIHAGNDNVLVLVIPGPVAVMRALCPERPAGDSAGAVAGSVRGAESGVPVKGAKVIVSWLELFIDSRGIVTQQRRVPVETGENGEYRICGVPGADTLLASAEAPGRQSGVIEVAIAPRGMTRQDFTLGDSTSAVAVSPDSAASAAVARQTTVHRGSAALSGVVVGPDGRPMSGAKVVVWGTGLETTTRADGRFALGGLPAGTFSVEARAIGFEPRRMAVDLASAKPADVQIALRQRLQELSRVVVMGKPSARFNDIDDFIRRARSGLGHYLMGSSQALRSAYSVSDAMRMMPGVQIVPSGQFGNVILLRGRCVPSVFVDGNEVHGGYESLDDLVPPQQVAGIEVYTGLGEAPAQYNSNGCGVVLIWTKR